MTIIQFALVAVFIYVAAIVAAVAVACRQLRGEEDAE